MKKWLFAIVVMFVCAVNVKGADDAPEKYRYKVEVGQFTKLRVLDKVNVIYRCVPDSTGLVVYDGEEDFADSFIFSLKGDMLRVQVSTDDIDKPNLPTLYIYSDFLTWVENANTGRVEVQSVAPCPEFEAVQVGNGTLTINNVKATKVKATLNTGNGSVNLSGDCHQASLRMIGIGTIQADQLKSEQVTCRVTGAGSIGCWPVQSLQVKGIGSCKVYYKGNPTIKKIGTSKIMRLPE